MGYVSLPEGNSGRKNPAVFFEVQNFPHLKKSNPGVW